MQNYLSKLIKKTSKSNMDHINQRTYKQVPEMVYDIKIENNVEEVQNVTIELKLENLDECPDNINTPLFECKKELPDYHETDPMNPIVEAYSITGLPIKQEIEIKHEVITDDPVYVTCDMKTDNMPDPIQVGNTSTSYCTQTSETASAESKIENKRRSISKRSTKVKNINQKSTRKLNEDIKAKSNGVYFLEIDYKPHDTSDKEAVLDGVSQITEFNNGPKSKSLKKKSKGKRNISSNTSDGNELASKRIKISHGNIQTIDTKPLTATDHSTDIKPIIVNKLCGDNKFICDICNYVSNNKKCIESHVTLHSGKVGNRSIYKCVYCGYITNTNSNFVKHMRTHTGEKPFSCNLCEFKCGQKSSLVTHIRTHTGEKPFSCDICDYKCCRKQHLVCHKRTHTGEKPYACGSCNFRCSYKQYLVKHARIHTGEKPFCCTVCNNRFGQKIHLETHMRTHTGEKPFSCTTCGFKCVQKSYLIIHMRTHTGEKPFRCNVCDYKCNRKQSLVHHNRTHVEKS